MKNLSIVVVLFVLTAVAAPVLAGEWFDMENCAICNHMSDHEDLMKNIKWETHLIDTGMLSVALIPTEYQEQMKEAHKKMEGTIARLEEGEKMELCGFCKSYGNLKAVGATSKEIETEGGNISLLTATDPEVIEKIHAHAKKTVEEYKKMLAKSGAQ